MASAGTERERVAAFLRVVDEHASTRVERLPFGRAYFNERVPRAWSRNFVAIDETVEPATLDEVVARSDRVQAEAGLDHRKIVFDAGLGAPEEEHLRGEGWRVQRNRVMVYRRGVAPQPGSGDAREVEPAALRPARSNFMRSSPDTRDEETIRQLLEADAILGAVAGERCFAAHEDGEVVSFCRVYSDGSVAQVEDVGTLQAARGRGHSRAVIATALAETLDRHDLTFILADDDDWPGDWYARLGFDAIAHYDDVVQNLPRSREPRR